MALLKIVAVLLSIIVVGQCGFCHTVGKEIYDVNNIPMFIKGISLGNWLNPEGYMLNFDKINYYRTINNAFSELLSEKGAQDFWKKFRQYYVTAEDFKYIKDVGFNTIRLPFDYKIFIDDHNPTVIKEEGFNLLNIAINHCKTYGLYIVLDLHSAPGGQTGANIDDSFGYPFLYDSEYYTNLTVTLWKNIANRYKNETTILGYELLNEPISTDFNTSYFIPKLEPLYKKITSAIREVDKNHIVILDGAVWASQFWSAFGAPFDSNLVYTFHKYWVDPNQGSIQEYVDFRSKYNVPVWMGESGENSDEWVNTFRILLERNGIHWSFWPYKKMSSRSGIRTIVPPNNWGNIVSYVEGDRSTLDAVAKNRPSFNVINAAFDGLINNIQFINTWSNESYLRALGLKG